ncbi:MAG: hypothetical protein HYT87_01720 [Nitrospirae bacterium]|nr:hypothetical protein [Nitrospirota bacterium]
MLRSRLIVLVSLLAVIAAMVATIRGGRLRRWAIGVLDRVPSTPLNVGEEMARKLESDWVTYEATFVSLESHTTIQYEGQVSLTDESARPLDIPRIRAWNRWWAPALNEASERYLPEGLEAAPFRDGTLYVEQMGKFLLAGRTPTSTRQMDLRPVLEASWKEGERPNYCRMYPEAALWNHRLTGVESSIVIMGPGGCFWPKEGDRRVSAFGFVARRWGSIQDQASGSFQGDVEWTEWVVLGERRGFYWNWLSDPSGRTLVSRGGAYLDGETISNARVEVTLGDITPSAALESGDPKLRERKVRLESGSVKFEYSGNPEGAAVKVSEGKLAYSFQCENVKLDGINGDPPTSCRGSGLVARR